MFVLHPPPILFIVHDRYKYEIVRVDEQVVLLNLSKTLYYYPDLCRLHPGEIEYEASTENKGMIFPVVSTT